MIALAPDEVQWLQSLLDTTTAIQLDVARSGRVGMRLAPVAQRAGVGSVSELIALARRERRGPLIDEIIDAIATHETSWFRDAHPFDAFANHLLPDVATSSATRNLVIWSAACSSGQEAYSLAMLLLDWLPAHPGYTAKIVGTDISPKMVERARTARFSQLEVNRGLRAPYLVKYFEQQGRDWILKQPLRDLCRFEKGNLAQPPIGVPTCDIVFLRNVLIYFDLATKRTVLSHVRRVLRPGGFLVLGGAESTLNLDDAFQRMELGRAVVFRHAGGSA